MSYTRNAPVSVLKSFYTPDPRWSKPKGAKRLGFTPSPGLKGKWETTSRPKKMALKVGLGLAGTGLLGGLLGGLLSGKKKKSKQGGGGIKRRRRKRRR